MTTEAIQELSRLLAERKRTRQAASAAPRSFGEGDIDRAEYERRVAEYLSAENAIQRFHNEWTELP